MTVKPTGAPVAQEKPEDLSEYRLMGASAGGRHRSEFPTPQGHLNDIDTARAAAGRRFHVEKFYRTNQFAPKEYPFSFLVYALSSFTYSLVAITMLTIYRVPEEPFRRLFPVDICACLVSFKVLSHFKATWSIHL